jgi:hypothetical protein
VGGACSTNREKSNVCMLLLGKPEGKGPLRRQRCRWAVNIKMSLIAIELGELDWISLAQDT